MQFFSKKLVPLRYAVTNVGVEVLMYMQIFILLRVAFFLDGTQRSSLIIT